MSNKPTLTDSYVHIKNDSPIARKTQFSIGDVIIPVRRATITLEPDDYTKVVLEVAASDIDISALQQCTRVEVVQDEDDDEGGGGE